MSGERHKSVRFLQGLFPDKSAKVQLVRIRKAKDDDKQTRRFAGISVEYVNPHTEAPKIVGWIDERNGSTARWDYYFALNGVLPDLHDKARKEHTHLFRGFHVDIDCGEDPEAQKKALAKLTTERPKGVPEPTAIVASGGGYWAFWMLAEPIEVGAGAEQDTQLVANLEDVNERLRDIFDGDTGTTDISRIARLAGTNNFASDKKPHRTDKLAMVIHDDWGTGQTPRRYTLGDFVKLPAAPRKRELDEKARLSVGVAKAEGDARACPPAAETWSWAALGYAVDAKDPTTPTNPDVLSAVIAQGPDGRVGLDGIDPGTSWKKPDGSWNRSEAVFWVCAEMDRRGVPPEVAAAVILDRKMLISDHLYSHVAGDGARDRFKREMYARRQVERAMKANDLARLAMLNDPDPPHNLEDFREWCALRYATVENVGNKYRVLIREGVDTDQHTFMTVAEFKRRFDGFTVGWPKEVKGETIFEPKHAGDAFLYDPQRVRYRGIVFDPRGDLAGPRDFNEWQGFAPYLGPKIGTFNLFRELVEGVICSGIDEHYRYLWRWMAMPIQQPGYKHGVAVALRGDYGTGKTKFAERYGDLFGPHFVSVSGTRSVAGHFNAHLHKRLLVLADEIHAHHGAEVWAALKKAITGETMMVEFKGADAFETRCYFNLIAAGNDVQILKVDSEERRWFVPTIKNTRKQDKVWFAKLDAEWADGGKEALYHHLLHEVDTTGFETEPHPRTAGFREQARHSLKGAEKLVDAFLSAATVPPIRHPDTEEMVGPFFRNGASGTPKQVFVSTTALLDWGQKQRLVPNDDGERQRMITGVGLELKKAAIPVNSEDDKRVHLRGTSRYVYGAWLDDVRECRRRYAEAKNWDPAVAYKDCPREWDVGDDPDRRGSTRRRDPGEGIF
ncbi:DUF5906 domain-containing protein [Tabrizicola thermarum]|uniref:DUF5906 domain-containing protein n=1 Tax=Tabrizicola thermarum TaxID=2670345 RepID=UPI000FFCBF80|nr:DUF5906 domain-containing protein [Tabrizicola thermarum]